MSSESQSVLPLNLTSQQKIAFLLAHLKGNTYFLTTQGIFRVSGKNSDKQSFIQHFNKANSPAELQKVFDNASPHIVAEALKELLRNLNPKLFNTEISQFVWQADEINLSEVLSKLSPDNKELLESLLDMIIEINSYSEENSMPINNLTRMIAPNCFEPCQDPQLMLNAISKQNALLEAAVSQHKDSLELERDLKNYCDIFRENILPYLNQGTKESQKKINNPMEVLERGKNNTSELSRIFDEFPVPVPDYALFRNQVNDVNEIREFYQKIYDQLLPTILNEGRTELSPALVSAIGKEAYEAMITTAGGEEKGKEEVAKQFVAAIMVSFPQKCMDQLKEQKREAKTCKDQLQVQKKKAELEELCSNFMSISNKISMEVTLQGTNQEPVANINLSVNELLNKISILKDFVTDESETLARLFESDKQCKLMIDQLSRFEEGLDSIPEMADCKKATTQFILADLYNKNLKALSTVFNQEPQFIENEIIAAQEVRADLEEIQTFVDFLEKQIRLVEQLNTNKLTISQKDSCEFHAQALKDFKESLSAIGQELPQDSSWTAKKEALDEKVKNASIELVEKLSNSTMQADAPRPLLPIFLRVLRAPFRGWKLLTPKEEQQKNYQQFNTSVTSKYENLKESYEKNPQKHTSDKFSFFKTQLENINPQRQQEPQNSRLSTL